MTRAPRAGAVMMVVAALACGGKQAATTTATPAPSTPSEKLLAMLPAGAQVVIELDLARLRANPAIGAVVRAALAAGAIGLPAGDRRAAASDDGKPDPKADPLAIADQLVIAAYGVGTAQAATLTVLSAPHDVPGTARLLDGYYALGPPEWLEQVQSRVSLASTGDSKFALRAPAELLELRDHAMPPNAPGASLRVTALLSFDARVALARQTGLDSAPARLSAWADVADDVALIVDCDADDPGGQTPGKKSDAPKRLEATLRGALEAVAQQPSVRALGLPASLMNAKFATRGNWVRAIIAIGPAHLQRVVDRASALLDLSATPSPAPPPGDHGS
jgi:hypothetical protein